MSDIRCGTCWELEPLKWKSVLHELPEPDIDVLIYYKPWDEMMVAHIQSKEVLERGGSFWFVSASENIGFDKYHIDWWMPLPQVPNE